MQEALASANYDDSNAIVNSLANLDVIRFEKKAKRESRQYFNNENYRNQNQSVNPQTVSMQGMHASNNSCNNFNQPRRCRRSNYYNSDNRKFRNNQHNNSNFNSISGNNMTDIRLPDMRYPPPEIPVNYNNSNPNNNNSNTSTNAGAVTLN